MKLNRKTFMSTDRETGLEVPAVVYNESRRRTTRGKTKKNGVTFVVKDPKNPKLTVVSEFIRSLNTGDGSENISGKIIIG